MCHKIKTSINQETTAACTACGHATYHSTLAPKKLPLTPDQLHRVNVNGSIINLCAPCRHVLVAQLIVEGDVHGYSAKTKAPCHGVWVTALDGLIDTCSECGEERA